ncbi:gluconokinase [Thermofilum pendens]|uniref:Carbohydrate kinase, FGGY n=1 Tax=Thermofilum pendens (strain DSM 2475 / Hrk 5) TaxID=368408 RepID=A1S0N7_THEPD|nr:gluconokinase [Thermofilum pendens]ABL79017.1 carbohydrate kinase, FGGY [Thermofilum pendens Hrk 5]
MKILAVDVGTSTLKSALVDLEKGVTGFVRKEIPILRPEPEAAEHDPETLFRMVLENLKETLAKAGVSEVDCLVLSGYLFGVLALDSKGEPLTNVLTWLDRRATRTLRTLFQVLNPVDVYRRTGCPPLFIYPLAKIFWLKTARENTYRATKRFLDAKGYLLLRLTGEEVMEVSSASGSQLLNLERKDWDHEIIHSAGLDLDKLPQLVEPDTIVGDVPVSIARSIGLKSPVPVVAGVFDGAAVSLGLGGLEEDVATSHLSTSTMLRVASRIPVIDSSPKMRFQTYYSLRGYWLPGGAVNSGAVVLRWFRDNFAQLERLVAQELGVSEYELLDNEAALSPPGSNGVVFLPYISGERFPEFGNNASGVIYGLREWHTRKDVLRAIMEGVAFNLNLVNEALRENGLSFREVRITGGGANSRLWLQILADVLGVPIKAFTKGDAALLGSSFVAKIAIEGNAAGVEHLVKFDKTVEPIPENQRIYMERFKEFKYLLNALLPMFSAR